MFYLTLRDSETRHKNVVDGLASFERLEMVSNMHGAKLFARNKKTSHKPAHFKAALATAATILRSVIGQQSVGEAFLPAFAYRRQCRRRLKRTVR